jgi:threonine dehydrogenase-like Zn-dependent dehydrogenase
VPGCRSGRGDGSHPGGGHLRLRSALLPAWRLRHGEGAGAHDPGHQMAGEVLETGAGVTTLRVGERVVVNPSRACGQCRFCQEGKANHCLDMRFYGSAMRMPHVQGGFREFLVCPATQAVPVPADLPLEQAVFAEPLSVCLHAARQAGALHGRRVLITGSGPIGALCVLVARHAGAREIVVTDLADAPLAAAKRVGADLRSMSRLTRRRSFRSPPTRDASTWRSRHQVRGRPSQAHCRWSDQAG